MNNIANDIIKEFGLEDLPENEKQGVVEQFADVVFQAITVRGLAALSESQKDALNTALAKDPENPDIMLDFFMATIPNFDAMVQQETARIRERAKIIKQAD